MNCIPETLTQAAVDELWLNRLRTALNSFKYRCEKFDPAGPDYFKGRKSSSLDLREDWEHIVGLVGSFEKKGRID